MWKSYFYTVIKIADDYEHESALKSIIACEICCSQALIKPTDTLNVKLISIQDNIPVSLRQAATIPGHHRVKELVQ